MHSLRLRPPCPVLRAALRPPLWAPGPWIRVSLAVELHLLHVLGHFPGLPALANGKRPGPPGVDGSREGQSARAVREEHEAPPDAGGARENVFRTQAARARSPAPARGHREDLPGGHGSNPRAGAPRLPGRRAPWIGAFPPRILQA